MWCFQVNNLDLKDITRLQEKSFKHPKPRIIQHILRVEFNHNTLRSTRPSGDSSDGSRVLVMSGVMVIVM